jgi:hypothetical protein
VALEQVRLSEALKGLECCRLCIKYSCMAGTVSTSLHVSLADRKEAGQLILLQLFVAVLVSSASSQPPLGGKSGDTPTVRVFPGTSNIPKTAPNGVSWPPAPAYSATVRELGSFSSLDDCQAACLAFVYRCQVPTEGGGCEDPISPVSGWKKCQSFSYVARSRRCVAIVAADEWLPSAEQGVASGVVTWPPQHCRNAADCSHNGVCEQSLCVCSAAWSGDRCQTLSLLPAARNAGLRSVDEGRNTSSWGGQALYDAETKLFHMWGSEIEGHCGIDAWTTNSHVIRATSEHAGGPYVRQEEVMPRFSHEPNVVRSPTGECPRPPGAVKRP